MESTAAAAAPPQTRRRPLRRVEYERLVELGVFGEERLELIEGELVPMSPQGSKHAFIIELLNDLLATAVRPRARVRVQSSFAASDTSMPEPDLAVVARESHRAAHPDEAFLVIEVSSSSLRDDLEWKVPLYARANVQELWVIDVEGEQVLVHTDAVAGRWRHVEQVGREGLLSPRAFPDVSLAVTALFEG